MNLNLPEYYLSLEQGLVSEDLIHDSTFFGEETGIIFWLVTSPYKAAQLLNHKQIMTQAMTSLTRSCCDH